MTEQCSNRKMAEHFRKNDWVQYRKNGRQVDKMTEFHYTRMTKFIVPE
jgi:hypothetical protein